MGSERGQESLEVSNGKVLSAPAKRCASLSYYPEWFPINDHLAIYQRHPTPCVWSCIKSTCERNSEVSCVWSHLVALIFTVQGFIKFLQLPSESFLHPTEERLLFSLTFTLACLCLAFSTIFHVFYNHSQPFFENTLNYSILYDLDFDDDEERHVAGILYDLDFDDDEERLDLLGIVLGSQGPWYPWIYYSFYCEKTFKFVYLATVAVGGIYGGWLLTRPHLLRECQTKERARISSAIFSLAVPAYSIIFYREGIFGIMESGQIWGIVGLFFGGIGVFVYCSKTPESLNSGQYHTLIGSHAIFHVLSAVCLWFAIYMCLTLQRRRFELGDTCPT